MSRRRRQLAPGKTLPDLGEKARWKQGRDGHPHLIPAGIAITGCGFLHQDNESITLVAV
jgi:hypothetical protein